MTSMKNRLFLSLAACATAVSLASASARAAESPMNEIDGATNMTLAFASGTSAAFQFSTAYSRLLYSDLLQGTLRADFFSQGGVTTYAALVGPTFDYSLDNQGIEDAFYLMVTGGIDYTNFGGGSTTSFAHHIELGKRFPLIANVSWRPAVIASGNSSAGSVEQYRIVPVQFAFIF